MSFTLCQRSRRFVMLIPTPKSPGSSTRNGRRCCAEIATSITFTSFHAVNFEGSRLFYTQVARVERREHAVDRYFKLAEAFGGSPRRDLRFAIPTGDQPPRFDAFPG